MKMTVSKRQPFRIGPEEQIEMWLSTANLNILQRRNSTKCNCAASLRSNPLLGRAFGFHFFFSQRLNMLLVGVWSTEKWQLDRKVQDCMGLHVCSYGR